MKTFDPHNLDHQTAPEQAFTFAAECRFEAPGDRDADGLRRMPVTVLARTGEPVWHWYWGKVVHDFEGMQHRASIPFDWRHDADVVVGYANRFEVKDGGLYLSGELISRDKGDRAAEIMDLGPSGIPYQQSITFHPEDFEAEYIPEEMSAEVNGLDIEGPCVVIRKWKLLRCAFCLSGVDGGSNTYFSKADSETAQFALNFTHKGSSMTKNENTAPKDGKPGTDANGGGAGQFDLAAERAKFEAEFKGQLKRYTDRFGVEDGTQYFEQGVDYSEALEKHIGKLEQIAQDAIKDRDEAKEKLASLDLGEKEGVDTGKPKSSQGDAKSQFSQIFQPKKN